MTEFEELLDLSGRKTKKGNEKAIVALGMLTARDSWALVFAIICRQTQLFSYFFSSFSLQFRKRIGMRDHVYLAILKVTAVSYFIVWSIEKDFIM
jgi:hypothetical protein